MKNAAPVKKICIVTTRHISYNPRVLKEADAFYDRGYSVSVVTVNNHPTQHRFDEEIMSTRSWKLKTVNFRREVAGERRYWLRLSLRQKLYSFLSRFGLGLGIAERAALKGFDALARLAIEDRASFYIAHHAEALGVAYAAAEANGTGFGFDAEDFHSGMNESGQASKEDRLIAYVERKYLPHCKHLTAASKGIGEAYSKAYGLPSFTTVLNVFPEEEFPAAANDDPVRFYWYSQVIGPNRSLETLLAAAATITEPFELHLRGSIHTADYDSALQALVRQLNLEQKVFFHPPILAEEIIADATRYDVGFALESAVSLNRNICVTNKIFTYLMAGLAIVGTDTDGQVDIFSHFPDAVRICRSNDTQSLADAMRHFLRHPDVLTNAKKAARNAAVREFNWEVELRKLMESFENATQAAGRTTAAKSS